MPELGVILAPSDGYLELAGSAQGARRFSKHILTVGETFVHPKSGAPLTVDESWWTDLERNWNDKVVPIVGFPLANAKNQHDESPERNAGRVVGLRREGRKIIADIEVPDPAIASKIGSTILGASAMLHMDYPDSGGRRRGKALCHVAATNRPHLTSLDDFAELEQVAATAEAGYVELPDGSWCPGQVLMLCASDPDVLPPVMLAEPDPEPYCEPDYYGGVMYDDDRQRDEIDRLSLDAQLVSSGRDPRSSYDHVKLEQEERERRELAGLTAEEITEEDCTEVGMRLVALSGLPFADLMAAAREIAFERDEQTANEYRAVAAGLVELTGRLGYDTDRLGDDDLVALAAVAEESRLDGTVSLAAGQQAEVDRLVALAAHPVNRKVTTRTRAHSNQLDDYEDPQDTDQPHRGGDVHAKVRALIESNPDLFSDGQGREGARSGSKSYGPKPYRSPGPAGKPQSRERLAAQIRARGPLGPYDK